MSETALAILLLTAASIGLTHTLIGPDHYVPFIAIARARRWTIRRTLAVTGACGLGHVLSSVAIGVIGLALGTALSRLEAIERSRGELASWALIAFGIGYGLWGLRRARHGHDHTHRHLGGIETSRPHGHIHLPGGRHVEEGDTRSITFWTLVIVFVLGPCEPLIPLVMFPAARHDWTAVALVTAAFGLATVGTMGAVVYGGLRGLSLLRGRALERYSHALAGGIIVLAGTAIRVFGI